MKTMLKTCKRHCLTILLHTSRFASGDAPVQVVVHCGCLECCNTAQITYEQAALLLAKAFREPTVIRDRMNTLLEYNVVELCKAEDAPYLFSDHDLSLIGFPLVFKRAS